MLTKHTPPRTASGPATNKISTNPIMYTCTFNQKNTCVTVLVVYWCALCSSCQICSGTGHSGEKWLHGEDFQERQRDRQPPSADMGPERLSLFSPGKESREGLWLISITVAKGKEKLLEGLKSVLSQKQMDKQCPATNLNRKSGCNHKQSECF